MVHTKVICLDLKHAFGCEVFNFFLFVFFQAGFIAILVEGGCVCIHVHAP